MPKADEKEFVDFYNFWKWEYTRRNPQHKPLVDAVFSGMIPTNTEKSKRFNAFGKLVACGDYTIRIYSKAHLIPNKLKEAPSYSTCEVLAQWPKGTKPGGFWCGIDQDEQFFVEGTFLYKSSTEILNAANANKLNHVYPILADDHMRYSSDKLAYDLQFNSIKWIEPENYHIMPTMWMREMFDGKCDLPWHPVIHEDGQVSHDEEFSGVFTEWKEERQEFILVPGEELLVVDMNKDIKEILSEVKKCYNVYHGLPDYQNQELRVRKEGAITRLPRELPRAIGLWLWDYMDERKIAWEYRSKSYEAFRRQYQSPDSKVSVESHDQDSQLGKCLKNARACVDRMEVLPMA